MRESIIEKYELQRITNWPQDVVNQDIEATMPDWKGLGYVREKQRQAERDMETMKNDLAKFIETGKIEHLAHYRMMLSVMVEEIEKGAWWAIAEGAR
jgi:hypothetical protein